MSNTRVLTELADILLDMEAELRRLDMWNSQPPSPEALASQQPFCIDTLEFHEWLQFILIYRMKIIIEADAPLPNASGILPMAEEFYKQDLEQVSALLNVIKRFDDLITEYHGDPLI